jgi:hypothetical protein
LFAAHNLSIGQRDQATAARGGVPGEATGPLNSKSVDKVSAGYDTGATATADAGDWNYTKYGQRLYRMMRAMGTGLRYAARPTRVAENGYGWPPPPGYLNN